MFHPQVEATDIQWMDMKTLTLQAMVMVADKKHYLCDFYHSVGSYWCVEEGLMRFPEEEAYQTFLFPILHRMRDANVSVKILKILRGECPQILKLYISGKSI